MEFIKLKNKNMDIRKLQGGFLSKLLRNFIANEKCQERGQGYADYYCFKYIPSKPRFL